MYSRARIFKQVVNFILHLNIILVIYLELKNYIICKNKIKLLYLQLLRFTDSTRCSRSKRI